MILGFTGTRRGLTGIQRQRLFELLRNTDELHHGDCVGADEECHDLALQAGVRSIVVHPPSDPKLRAWCAGPNVTILEPKPYLKRNADIVEDSDATVGCPKESYEPDPARGQGTWSTIRRARNSDKLLEIIWPKVR